MKLDPEAQRLWDSMDGLVGRPDAERLCALVLEETAPKKRRLWNPMNLSMAASVAVCALVAGAFLVGRHYMPTDRYATGAGQRSTVVLEDGSQVILNVATKLDVRFTRDRRELRLKAGEAVFTVAQDSQRPFSVRVGDGEVTAMGTRFQVRNDAKQVTVTLLEGRVAVDRREEQQHVQLTPGDRVRFQEDAAELQRETVDTEVAASWTTGKLKFRDTPLSEVLAEVNRYTRTQIRLRDAALAKMAVNGVFEMGNVESVVGALQVMLPVEVVTRDRGEVVLSGR